MNPGQKVICVDDQGWLIPAPTQEHLAPKKGQTYTVREYERFGSVGAISLIEWHPEDFYRACRFRVPKEITRAQCIQEAQKLAAHLRNI